MQKKNNIRSDAAKREIARVVDALNQRWKELESDHLKSAKRLLAPLIAENKKIKMKLEKIESLRTEFRAVENLSDKFLLLKVRSIKLSV